MNHVNIFFYYRWQRTPQTVNAYYLGSNNEIGLYFILQFYEGQAATPRRRDITVALRLSVTAQQSLRDCTYTTSVYPSPPMERSSQAPRSPQWPPGG